MKQGLYPSSLCKYFWVTAQEPSSQQYRETRVRMASLECHCGFSHTGRDHPTQKDPSASGSWGLTMLISEYLMGWAC